MTRFATRMLIAGLMLPLAACGQDPAPPANEASAATATTETVGVTRQEAAPEQPAAPAMPALAAIQSQPGPDGSQVDLLKLAVTGDILTATFRCSSDQRINTEAFRITDVSVIDDATSQRIGVLKDNDGNWLVSRPTGDNMMVSCETRPGVFWAKFPAPPATSRTVSINLPDTAPFDGVPVTR